MAKRYVPGVTPEWTIAFSWSPVRKSWHLRAVDRHGNVVGSTTAQTTAGIDTDGMAVLLRELRSELESQLPFS